MNLSTQQQYGTTMFIIYNKLPLPVRHEYFSKHMVHPIVYLLRPHIKKSIRVKNNSYHYRKAKLGHFEHDYEVVELNGNVILIDTTTCRITKRTSWGLFWASTNDCYYFCSSYQTQYQTCISDSTKEEYGLQYGFDGDMEASEVECRKNVCSKVLMKCKCNKCHYLDNIMYPVKYLGNYPFNLKNIVADTINANIWFYENDIDIRLMFYINGDIVQDVQGHEFDIHLADINNPSNYIR